MWIGGLFLLWYALFMIYLAADIVGAPFLIFDTTVQILKVRIKENNRLLGL